MTLLKNNLKYSSTKKNWNFGNYSLPIVYLKDIYQRRLSIYGADKEQGMFYNDTKRANHGRVPNEKGNFWKNLGFLSNEREKITNAFGFIHSISSTLSKILEEKETKVHVSKY